jgi:UDP-N-acetyl-D-mannosaminuronate dehydrogenase
MINIALANELSMVCDKLGISVWEVIDAAATKPFGFMKFTPGPGLGGHCIPLDPHYLSWKMRNLSFKTRMIELASEINAEMPEYTVNKVALALNEHGLSLKGSRILILGIAYKKDMSAFMRSRGGRRERPFMAKASRRSAGAPAITRVPVRPQWTRSRCAARFRAAGAGPGRAEADEPYPESIRQ